MTFDISERDITGLIQAVQQSDVTRFHLVTSECEIYISRSDDEFDRSPIGAAVPDAPTRAGAPAPAAVAEPAPVAVAPALVAPVPVVQGGGEPVDDSAGLVVVTAPMIGIFYCAPEPGADPYITVGSLVQKDTTVGLVEAMKLFTAVEAGIDGTVEEILVANGDYVEYGQPLVRVRPTASQGA